MIASKMDTVNLGFPRESLFFIFMTLCVNVTVFVPGAESSNGAIK